ncbi:trypsin-like peptidase domain-containing protein [Streptomyces sp. NPDC002619]|uniref:trypsin-like peptidase domain-containing protein n=1 Tax=Streptomyces sp. NPDC002619 TaxID=3364655 RepID=UPI0036A01BE0
MDVQRVVEVWDPAGRIAGTGYLITDRLVLTTYHNIEHAGSTPERVVEVRRLALHGEPPTTWVPAEVVWPEQPLRIEQDPHTDVALLLITDSAWQPPVSATPVRWGRLPPPSHGAAGARVACVAVGFPQAEQRDGKRDTKQIRGHIETLSGLKSGLITAHIDHVATPSTAGAPSSWSGASGAALFCGNLLTGVLTTDRARHYPGTQLIAVPLATLAARPGFTSTIKAAGNPLSLEDITTCASSDHPPVGPYDDHSQLPPTSPTGFSNSVDGGAVNGDVFQAQNMTLHTQKPSKKRWLDEKFYESHQGFQKTWNKVDRALMELWGALHRYSLAYISQIVSGGREQKSPSDDEVNSALKKLEDLAWELSNFELEMATLSPSGLLRLVL